MSGESADRYDRQVRAFGIDGQKAISGTTVAVVGLGGLGSHVVQQLAHLGVGELALIDHDHVTETGLNRLVGATAEDAAKGRKKVDAIRDYLVQIRPEMSVKTLPVDLRSREAIEALIEGPDVILGCVDNDGARLILTELAAAYSKPLIDLASDVHVEDGKVVEFGGRIVVARPGDFCLYCANEIDRLEAAQALESEPEREFRAAHHYGLGPREPSPAVVSLNGTIASIAVTEFMMLVTGLRPPHRKLTYTGMRGRLSRSRDTSRDNCWICKEVTGSGDAANVFRYAERVSLQSVLS